MRKRLIVNADDFGLTEGVNRAVAEGHRHGIITSATVMANGLAFDSAIETATANPLLGVGVHLNLVEGPTVAPVALVPSLVGRDGEMSNAPAALAYRVARGHLRRPDVERELRAQIEKVLDAGVRPTHVDGHKHAHLAPQIFDIVVKLAIEYGIRGIRCAVEASAGVGVELRARRSSSREVASQHFAGRALSWLARLQRRKIERAGLASPERILGITQTGFLCYESLARLLSTLRDAPAELMCHPGFVDAALGRVKTRLRDSRERELALLTAPETKALIDREGIELITYGDLSHPV